MYEHNNVVMSIFLAARFHSLAMLNVEFETDVNHVAKVICESSLACDFQEGGSHDHLGGPMAIPETKFKIITIIIVLATLVVGIKVPNSELHF